MATPATAPEDDEQWVDDATPPARLTLSGAALAMLAGAAGGGALDGWLSPGIGIVFAAIYLPLCAWVAARAREHGFVATALPPWGFAAAAVAAALSGGLAAGRGLPGESLAVMAAAAPALIGGLIAAAVGAAVGRAEQAEWDDWTGWDDWPDSADSARWADWPGKADHAR